MKPNDSNQFSTSNRTGGDSRVPAQRRKAAPLLEQAKTQILSEFQGRLKGHRHLLRLAVNEAEALAWGTDYPHLLFPTLAAEKAQAVAKWQARQRIVQQRRPWLAFAA